MIELSLLAVTLGVLSGVVLWLFFWKKQRSWARLELIYWSEKRPVGEGFFCKLFFDGSLFWESRYTQVLIGREGLFIRSLAEHEAPLRILWTQITGLQKKKKWDEEVVAFTLAGFPKEIALIAMGDSKVYDDIVSLWEKRFDPIQPLTEKTLRPKEVLYL